MWCRNTSINLKVNGTPSAFMVNEQLSLISRKPIHIANGLFALGDNERTFLCLQKKNLLSEMGCMVSCVTVHT